MRGKKKADQQAIPREMHLDNTSIHAQRTRLLERLRLGPIDTITARHELNVMMPAARIKELRDNGHAIKTHRLTITDEQGRPHHGVALYFLTQQEA